MKEKKFNIFIDTGGTFTDCIGIDSDGNKIMQKVLSSGSLRAETQEWVDEKTFRINDRWQLKRDILKGYDFFLQELSEKRFKVIKFDPLNHILKIDQCLKEIEYGENFSFEITAYEEAPVLGTRLITQTSLDEKFPPLNIRLGSTRGTNALLENKGAKTALITTRGFKDLLWIGNQSRPDIFAREIITPPPLVSKVIEIDERIDTRGNVIKKADFTGLERSLKILKNEGFKSIAIAFLNAYLYPVHEKSVKKLVQESGFKFISLSSELSSLIKLLERTETAVVNAYLSPVIFNYLENINSSLRSGSLKIMTSAGSLHNSRTFNPKDSLLSGPAGGVVGAALSGKRSGIENLISFDMGGTSTDVSRYSHQFDYCYELKVGDARIMSPALSIETVAAGGGSICGFDGFKLHVGPESAGAWPGPACYGAGGPLTLTDINLLIGRLSEKNFTIPVDFYAAGKKLEELLMQIEKSRGRKVRSEDILHGFLDIANETMSGAIRKISLGKGHDPKDFALVSFGGAGGLHACGIAENLGIEKILNPPEAGLLSAWGIANARMERFASSQILKSLEDCMENLPEEIQQLKAEAIGELVKDGVEKENTEISKTLLYLRFKGQDSSIEIEYHEGANIKQLFHEKYQKLYGHWVERELELEAIRVVAWEKNIKEESKKIDYSNYPARPDFDSPEKTPEYQAKNLMPGAQIHGPALLLNEYSTFYLEKSWEYQLDENGTGIAIRKQAQNGNEVKKDNPEEAELELYTHRFMTIAENMGAMLQRTSLSVNIKERLDFSCALLDSEGYLVANAPHIPVHLGGLGICVRELLKKIDFQPGDTVVTNHPGYGGSHLPDVTTITPVFTKSHKRVAFVVNRAHHSEIGGLTPGSMPPSATSLVEEGVVISPFFIVRNGKANWEGMKNILKNAPYPSRAINENLADLNASLAANLKGVEDTLKLIETFGENKTLHYFRALRKYARGRMKEKLSSISPGHYMAEELLDDGSSLKVNIRHSKYDTVIDFEGSGPVSDSNLNATVAIVNSVVIYVLRLLLNEPIPLNDGLLDPVNIYIPRGMLNPEFPDDIQHCPAVVGGNVEISQRLTDCLLKAFGTMAASQGTMNNVLFGNEKYGYYETLAGGTGAGDGFHGRDATHHHMTNTRITDPEIMEHRYPIRINRFEIRRGSGGKGKWKGGNGLVREYEFLEKMNLSLLSQRRNSGPYGLLGGRAGKPGEQQIIRKDGRKEEFNGIDNADLNKGDRFIIRTPGGGGYGKE